MSDTIKCECGGSARQHIVRQNTKCYCKHDEQHGFVMRNDDIIACPCTKWRPVNPAPGAELTPESVIGMCNNGVYDQRFRGDVEFKLKNLLPEFQQKLLDYDMRVAGMQHDVECMGRIMDERKEAMRLLGFQKCEGCFEFFKEPRAADCYYAEHIEYEALVKRISEPSL